MFENHKVSAMKRLQFSIFLFLILFNISAYAFQDSLSLEAFFIKNQIQANETENGLYYSIEQEGWGAFPKVGDYVKVHYVGSLLNGVEFDRSAPDEPFVFQLGYRQVILGWDKGISLFRVGSKGKLYIPSELGYGGAGAGKVIPPNSDLIFEIEVLEVMDLEAYDRFMEQLEAKERKRFEEHRQQQFVEDKKLINDYAAAHKLKVKRTPSGLSYVLKKKGKGSTAAKGNTLIVHYEGYLPDDTLFDSSFKKKKPFKFQLGNGKTIDGWEEGLQYFKKGSEGWLLIPSQLAYGPRSIDDDGIIIPANSVLIFKIKVVDILND
jgi:FKBP-type peptidyl-prolyl cis-trans isomerase